MKKTNLILTIAICIITLTVGLFVSSNIASAQATPNGSGQALEIAPPVLILTADPGQTINSVINLRDVSRSPLIVTNQINDFVANGEDGIPKIILDNNEQSNPYSIKSWINNLPELTLQPKQIVKLPITIKVPTSASPGGYYGVIRFTATPTELKSTGVALSASLGALVLLKVNGAVKESLSIESFTASEDGKSGTLFESAPLMFIDRFKNTGNIHEQPTGQVTITDMFNKKIAALNVNLPQSNILPQSIRKFEQPLDSSVIGNKMLFGRYTANLKVTYGANNQVLTKSISFWVIPYRLIAVIIAALIVIFLVLFFLIRRYNRYVVRKAQGTTTKHKKRKNK